MRRRCAKLIARRAITATSVRLGTVQVARGARHIRRIDLVPVVA